jgi:hypothetical protein
MEMSVIKTVRFEIKNGLGQRMQLTPDEAWAILDRLPGLLADAGETAPAKPPQPLPKAEAADSAELLSRTCPWCGGSRVPGELLCHECMPAMHPDVLDEIKKAYSASDNFDAYFAAVHEIWRREAAKPTPSKRSAK